MSPSPKLLRSPGFLAGAGVLLVSAFASSRPFWSDEFAQQPWMTFVRDDFFYYLKIAQNLATGLGSTFNGIVSTNGYHPLWMLLLSMVCRISTAPLAILGFVAVTAVLSTLSMYYVALRFLERCEVVGWLGALTATYVALSALSLCFYGMEVTLAMPLALALALHVLRWSKSSGDSWWLTAGLLTSLLVLARVDAMLLAGLFAVALLSQPETRRRLRWSHAAALLAGCLPMIGYFLWNRVRFGLWLPVSGVAKQLRHGWMPSAITWGSVIDGPRSAWLNLLLIAIAFVVALASSRRSNALRRAVLLMLLAYPALFVLLLSIRSDWEMWPWYAWIWRPATCAALAVLLTAVARQSKICWRVTVAVMGLLVAMRVARSEWLPGQEDYYEAASEVRGFAISHPGTYAMGDRAGMIAWLLPDPLVQTEGLVMDRRFVEHIRRQEDLLAVLRSYGVRYYIADDWAGRESLMHNGCFDAVEPSEGGRWSPRMHARLCQPPVFHTTHSEVTTMIFDLSMRDDRER